jgi:hypothetical protein
MANFGKNCNSDPTSGCSTENAGLVASITASYNNIATKLDAIDVKMGNVITEIEECCEETNSNLSSISSKMSTLNTNIGNCCEDIMERLDIIIGLLQTPSTTGVHITYSDFVCEQMVQS